MSEPSKPPTSAWLYDGLSAIKHAVSVRRTGDLLTIEGHDPVAITLLQASDLGPGIYARVDIPGWRLGFDGAIPDELIAALPRALRYGRWIDRFGLWQAAAVLAPLSILMVVGGMYGVDIVGRSIPFAWEQRIGESMTGDFGPDACTGAAGQAALDGLAHRLSPTGRPMHVRVVDVPLVNAVALPGGQILIFSQLIEDAQSPDEVAGVLAHEIGHVDRRHVMIALLRRFGLGLLLGSGGQSGQYAQTLIDSRYSREAEGEADSYSIAHLRAAGINPAATAALFDRFAKTEKAPEIFAYLASHPPSATRRELFKAAGRKMRDAHAALTLAEWQAVRTMCAERPKIDIKSRFRF